MAYNLNAETFSEYGIGILFLLLRLLTRLKMGGIRGLRLDDAFAVLAMIFFTMQTVNIYKMDILGTNIGLNEKTAMLVSETKIPNMVQGSKLAFMNWIWYICYIWCLKGVLLCLYWKLTEGTWHRHVVAATSVFCVATWLVCLLTHVCLCTPVYRNWQIQPYPGDLCTLRQPLYIEIAIFNVLSDLCIILIPIPILITLQIPLQRRLVLALMFSSGVFIMICTILRAYYSLASITSLPTALGWASRECFVAALVAALPGIKPLFRNTRFLGSSNRRHDGRKGRTGTSGGYRDFGSGMSGNTKTFVSTRGRGGRGHEGEFEMDAEMPFPAKSMGADIRVSSSGGSEEFILDGVRDSRSSLSGSRPQNPFAIRVTTEYHLESEGVAQDSHKQDHL